MLHFDVDVIKTKLKPTEKDGEVRYYHKSWQKAMFDEMCGYCGGVKMKSVNTVTRGIKVYFTGKGMLIIDGCEDPEFKRRIERYIQEWYDRISPRQE